jgi:hypothetical protein
MHYFLSGLFLIFCILAARRHVIRRGGVQWLALAAVCAVLSMILFRAGG